MRRGRWPAVSPVLVDWVLAGLATVATQLSVWVGSDGAHHQVATSALAVVITVPIAVRRRFPTWIGIAVPAISAVDHGLWNPASIGYPLATFLALYALAVWTSTRLFVMGTVVVATASLASSAIGGASPHDAIPYVVVIVVVMVLIRRVVGDRERRAELAERERDVAAREAVMQERARIARELHDVIAHNVSMMVVQAGAERRSLASGQGVTRDVLQAIENSGRGALTEMRRLVGMLRDDGREPLTPQPRLDDLPRLVTQLRSAGLPVELQVEGRQRELGAGIELSAYRIVQEALTNCLKHAGETRATVRVRYDADALELEITDNGAGPPEHEGSAGHGLVGMRERVALYGGRFDAGRRADGGFSVRILLPIR
jgi:signal transduction histidine kinase